MPVQANREDAETFRIIILQFINCDCGYVSWCIVMVKYFLLGHTWSFLTNSPLHLQKKYFWIMVFLFLRKSIMIITLESRNIDALTFPDVPIAFALFVGRVSLFFQCFDCYFISGVYQWIQVSCVSTNLLRFHMYIYETVPENRLKFHIELVFVLMLRIATFTFQRPCTYSTH